ncbi:MAG TPA: phosphopantetheine-binding protein [Mycobacteriales bacterium]
MSTPNPTLEDDLKKLIIDLLARDDLDDANFDNDAPLLDESLGFDSLDVLEIVDAVQERYEVTLDIGDPEVRKAFASIRAIAQHLRDLGVSAG